jgi:S1-C subfamily serine protease
MKGDVCMKKNFVCIIFGVFLALSVNAAADTYYQFVASQNTLYVDGVKIEMPLYNYQYTNYAPIRAVAEAVGLDVNVVGTRIDFTSKSIGAEKTTAEIAQNVESTVFIRNYDTYNMAIAKIISTGSGVVLDNGIIVTNFHVAEDGFRYGIVYNDTPEGEEYRTSSWIAIDQFRDICILPSPNTYAKGAKLGNSDNLKLGEKVVAIGSPLGLKNTVSEGIISGFRRIDGYNFIQITAPISPGSSGGGLFNAQGELIGITTLKVIDGESLNFAIPINEVKTIVNSKDTQLEIELNNQMKFYTYNNKTYFFNYISSLDNNGFYRVSYFLFEEYEGSNEFIQSYENNADFRDKLYSKLAEISEKLRDYGYGKSTINIFSGNKSLTINYENGISKKINDSFVIK